METSDVWILLYFLVPIIFGAGWYFGAKWQEKEDKKKEKQNQKDREFRELIDNIK